MPKRKSPDSDMDEQPMFEYFIYSMQAKLTTSFLSSENEGDTESESNDEDEYVYDGDTETESEYEVETADKEL
jgi:hypothetical protein